MNEFELIERLIQGFGDLTEADFIDTGAGDDAAIFAAPSDQQLVVSTDTLVPDVHFPAAAPSDLVGYRAVAINVSDLAAMGATPLGMTIALTVESLDGDWIERFAHGVAVAAREYEVKIFGGNLARGPLNVNVTIHGVVPSEEASLRSNAKVGDDIWLTGTLGATTAFLKTPTIHQASLETLLAQRDESATVRYFLPHARTDFAVRVRDLVHGAIDISDGLASELTHLTKASQCGALINLERLPVWRGLKPVDVIGPDDSYELLFTASQGERARILEIGSATYTPVVVIGNVIADRTVSYSFDGKRVSPRPGFDHFA